MKAVRLVSFSCLGYQAVTLPIKECHSPMEVRMKSEVFRLEEVKVAARRIEERHDTLVYSVSGFSQPQDRSIADVIAKMPGMEVRQDGQIAFEGKAINKFYVEGLDLMGNQYTLASENMSRKRVKSVEVLRNHQPVEVLRGKVFSEQAALNLVLEDDSKFNWAGTAELGGGANADDLLYSNRLLAMLFGKQRQNLSIYKNDNTGIDLYREISPVTLSEVLDGRTPEDYLVASVTRQVPPTDARRYTFNRSHLVATNHLERLSPCSSLRTQISYYDEAKSLNHSAETVYLFTDSLSAPYVESNRWKGNLHRLDASVLFEKNDERLYLSNHLSGSFDWTSATDHTQWNHTERMLNSDFERQFLKNDFALTLPLHGGKFLSLSSLTTYNRLPQRLTVWDNRLQRLDESMFYTHTYTSFRHRAWATYLHYTLGIEAGKQRLSAANDPQGYLAPQHIGYARPYIEPSIRYENETTKWEAGVRIKLYNERFHLSGQAEERATYVCPEGHLSMRYTPTGVSTFTIRYRNSYDIPSLPEAFRGSLYTTYHTLADRTRPLEPENTYRIGASYQYSHPIRGRFFSIAPSLSLTSRHSAPAAELGEDAILKQSYRPAEYTSALYQLSGRLSQSFARWKSLLAVSGSYFHRADKQFRQSELQPYRLETSQLAIEHSARPLPFFSYEIEGRWQASRLKSGTTHTSVNLFRYAVKAVCPLSEHWLLQVDNYLHRTVEADTHTWFTDFLVRYTGKRIEAELSARNLLGHEEYTQEFVNSMERSVHLFEMRPREVIAKLSFSF